ncbi:MAG: DUF2218 domain-containing protein [Sphingobium sp.]|nr:DUF2218 domain-containing protein [Sphingobium sp.]
MGEKARAIVPTEKGSRYLQQLCKHWSHKFEVSFDEQQGRVDLIGTELTLKATPTTLEVALDAPDSEALIRMKKVAADHLDRFAFKEAPLPFDWQPA